MLNCIAMMGRLVADPELKKTSSDVSVASFRIAVDREFVRQGEARQADFISVVCWRQTADFVCRYFGKGDMIALNGRLQTRQYDDRDGKKHTVTEIVAENVSFCGGKSEDGKQRGADANPAETGDFSAYDADDMPF